jgi:hypothetical protein
VSFKEQISSLVGKVIGDVRGDLEDGIQAIVDAAQADNLAQITTLQQQLTDATAAAAAAGQQVTVLQTQVDALGTNEKADKATIDGLQLQHASDQAALGQSQATIKIVGDQLVKAQTDLAAANAAKAALQAKYDAYVKAHPDTATTVFGFRAGPNVPNGPAGATAQKRLTDLMGGPLGVERIFNIGGSRWTVPVSTAKSIILSIDLDPAGLLAGNYTAPLKTLLAGCSGFETVWLIPMSQEPDLGNKGVTPQQSQQMITYVKKNIAFPNVKVGTTVTSFEVTQGVDVSAYFGPDADFAGMDCYENPPVAKLNSLVKVYTMGVQLAQKLGLPLIIPETAIRPAASITEAVHAQHVADGIAYLKGSGVKVEAVAWFDSNKAGTSANEADWRIENYPASTALWKAEVRASAA